jgi:hypothetical protein
MAGGFPWRAVRTSRFKRKGAKNDAKLAKNSEDIFKKNSLRLCGILRAFALSRFVSRKTGVF